MELKQASRDIFMTRAKYPMWTRLDISQAGIHLLLRGSHMSCALVKSWRDQFEIDEARFDNVRWRHWIYAQGLNNKNEGARIRGSWSPAWCWRYAFGKGHARMQFLFCENYLQTMDPRECWLSPVLRGKVRIIWSDSSWMVSSTAKADAPISFLSGAVQQCTLFSGWLLSGLIIQIDYVVSNSSPSAIRVKYELCGCFGGLLLSFLTYTNTRNRWRFPKLLDCFVAIQY